VGESPWGFESLRPHFRAVNDVLFVSASAGFVWKAAICRNVSSDLRPDNADEAASHTADAADCDLASCTVLGHLAFDQGECAPGMTVKSSNVE
jgi:hypothetical protein